MKSPTSTTVTTMTEAPTVGSGATAKIRSRNPVTSQYQGLQLRNQRRLRTILSDFDRQAPSDAGSEGSIEALLASSSHETSTQENIRSTSPWVMFIDEFVHRTHRSAVRTRIALGLWQLADEWSDLLRSLARWLPANKFPTDSGRIETFG